MKKQSIDMNQFRLIGGVTVEKVDGGNLVTFPPEGGRMILAGAPMNLGGVDWAGATHIIMDMTTLEDFEVALVCHFASGPNPQDPSVMFNTGTLPGIRVMNPMPLAALDSSKMFIPRTPAESSRSCWDVAWRWSRWWRCRLSPKSVTRVSGSCSTTFTSPGVSRNMLWKKRSWWIRWAS